MFCNRCQCGAKLVQFVHNKRFMFWIYRDEPVIDSWMVRAHDERVYRCPRCEALETEYSSYDLKIQDDDEYCLN